MRKIILAAALVGTMLTGAVAPAFADTDTVFGTPSISVEQALSAKGFNVVNIAEWGTRIQATVIDANGHQSLKYFDPDTLAQVN